jgi:hypothetical protein
MRRILLLLVVSAILVVALSAPAVATHREGRTHLGERICTYASEHERLDGRPNIIEYCTP